MTLRVCVPGAQQGVSLPQVTAQGFNPSPPAVKTPPRSVAEPGLSAAARMELRVRRRRSHPWGTVGTVAFGDLGRDLWVCAGLDPGLAGKPRPEAAET